MILQIDTLQSGMALFLATWSETALGFELDWADNLTAPLVFVNFCCLLNLFM